MKPTMTAATMIFTLLLGALLLGAGGDDSEEAKRLEIPLAVINGNPLTVYYFETAAKKLGPFDLTELTAEAGRQKYLANLIAEELQALEAMGRGYDKDQEVQELFKTKLASMMEIYIGANISDAEPTEDELRRYYDEHPEKFNKPEMMRARHILISDKAKAVRLLKEFQEKKATEDEFRLGDRETGRKGLDIGYFPRPGERREDDPGTLPAVAEAAFKLERNGEIFPEPVASQYGFHILMRTGFRPKEHVSFEEARKQGLSLLIKRENHRKQVEAAVEALKTRFPVTVFEKALDDVVVDTKE